MFDPRVCVLAAAAPADHLAGTVGVVALEAQWIGVSYDCDLAFCSRVGPGARKRKKKPRRLPAAMGNLLATCAGCCCCPDVSTTDEPTGRHERPASTPGWVSATALPVSSATTALTTSNHHRAMLYDIDLSS